MSTKKNRQVLITILAVVAGMIGLSFASVPLYKLFCQVTGYDGTTQVADKAPASDKVLDREITIKFNADTSPDLDWRFKPDKRKITVKIGQEALTSYEAENLSSRALAGTAVYNVTPEKAGKYFHKIQCFCFDKQVLEPGQDMHMPVVFYVDPALAQDREMDDVTSITLSYTFFPADSKRSEEHTSELQ